MAIQQLELFPLPEAQKTGASLSSTEMNRANFGTFQDSLRAPVHRWFTYPAGFSYKAVEEAFRLYAVMPGMTVYDPFAGTGTTNVVASQQGINSFGIEAHPFVAFVARTKLYWDFDIAKLHREVTAFIRRMKEMACEQLPDEAQLATVFPELVRKCYSPEKLALLYLCREAVTALPPSPFRNLARLGLTNLLRSVADVATGWPYIAPKKAKNAKNGNHRQVLDRFKEQLLQMLGDIQAIRPHTVPAGQAIIVEGDARQHQPVIDAEIADLAFTSPPYLNNYDYSDRTRLEMYFWGEAKTWNDITRKVRTRLIMSATTQIARSDYDMNQLLSADLRQTAPDVAADLLPKISELSVHRLQKGGKKSYDIMVAGYFNDMLQVFRETYRVLKPGSHFVLILGDSAPYGVYIPTDTYLGEIGKAVGFTDYTIEDLRSRGGKWKDNPQRHSVALKECILMLQK